MTNLPATSRRLPRCECLERRWHYSAAIGNAEGIASTVNITAVYAAGSAWSAAFLDGLAAAGQGDVVRGYQVTDAGEHGAPLSWVNLDTFSFDLSGPVPAELSIDTSRVQVVGGSGRVYQLASVDADASRQQLTLRLSRVVPNDKLRFEFELNGDGAADREIRLNVLPADADRSGGAVSAADLVATRNRVGQAIGGAKYSSFGDFDGSGAINAVDLVSARNRVGTTLPVLANPTFQFSRKRIAPPRAVDSIIS